MYDYSFWLESQSWYIGDVEDSDADPFDYDNDYWEYLFSLEPFCEDNDDEMFLLQVMSADSAC